eukprot:12781265-Alexandrium_andersonii.AAC.1
MGSFVCGTAFDPGARFLEAPATVDVIHLNSETLVYSARACAKACGGSRLGIQKLKAHARRYKFAARK